MNLSSLKNTTRKEKKRRRVGRGIGSGLGKTCGRGEKGMGSRSGNGRRLTYEGGQFRLFMKLPTRGFSNARFRKRLDAINLSQIDKLYEDGEVVNSETLRKHGYISGTSDGIKILGEGELTKKVSIEVDAISQGARDKLQTAKISFKIIGEETKDA